MAKQSAKVKKILDEMAVKVNAGLGKKKLGPGVDKALRANMGPKIKRRLDAGGDWEKEKSKPLIVAKHMGKIAALLSKTTVVDIAVADAALTAVKSDEHCQRGIPGAGNWCF